MNSNIKVFFEQGYLYAVGFYIFSVGLGRISLKSWGIPLSFGGSLKNIILFPLIFALGKWVFSRKKDSKDAAFSWWFYILFSAWAVLSFFIHGPITGEGLKFFIYFFTGLTVFAFMVPALNEPRYLRIFLCLWFLGTVFSIGRGLLEHFFPDFFTIKNEFLTGTSDRRLFTPIGHPNHLGSYLVLLLPFSFLYDWKTLCSKGKILGWGVNLILLTGTIMSYSRSSWMALCFGWGVLFLFFNRRYILPLMTISLLGMSLFLFLSKSPHVLHSSLKHPLAERIYSLLNFKNDSSVMERIYCWKTSVNIIRQHFLTGIGSSPARFQHEYLKNKEPFARNLMPHSHHLFLQIWIVFGLPGLILFLFVLGNGFLCWNKRIRQRPDPFSDYLIKALLWSGSGFLLYSLMDCTLFTDRVSSLFWFVVALSYRRTDNKNFEL